MGSHSVLLVGASDIPTTYLMAFEQYACSVGRAANIVVAMQMLNSNRSFNLVFLDAGTQGRSSLDLMAFLQSRNIRIPVVALCAVGQEGLRTELWNAGIIEAINRPFTLEPLSAILSRTFVSQSKPRSNADETVFLPRATVPSCDSVRTEGYRDEQLTPNPGQPLTSSSETPAALSNLMNHPEYVVFRIGQSLSEVERQMILRTVEMTHGNRTKAAQILGISVRTLYTKLLEFEQEQKTAVVAKLSS